ncbi:MAG: hypothetical protein Q9170_002635 [Blastenia crenularia]
MPPSEFDLTRLQGQSYDLNDLLALARFQSTVDDFIALAREDKVDESTNQQMIDMFCELVKDEEVWFLAQTMVPEFRSLKIDRIKKAIEARNSGCMGQLDRILLRLEDWKRLPVLILDRNILIGEHDMLDQRHRMMVEHIATGGRGRMKFTPPDPDVLDRHQRITSQVQGEFQYCVRLWSKKEEKARLKEENVQTKKDRAKTKRPVKPPAKQAPAAAKKTTNANAASKWTTAKRQQPPASSQLDIRSFFTGKEMGKSVTQKRKFADRADDNESENSGAKKRST